MVYDYSHIQVYNTYALIISNFGRKPPCEISNSANYLSDYLVKVVLVNIPHENPLDMTFTFLVKLRAYFKSQMALHQLHI
jgi:hypothetical protein